MTVAAGPPTIDIEPLRGPDGVLDPACVERIDTAARDTGFFVVVGHGVDLELARAFDVGRTFFALDQAAKERTPRIGHYGYVPQWRMAIDASRPTGHTEYLDLGLAGEVAMPAVDELEGVVRAYQAAALGVAGSILRALACALGVDPGFFAARMSRPQCKLRFLHYPPAPPAEDGSLPVQNAPHTDYGAITLLATDGKPGLEVRPVGAEWTPVDAPSRSLVVNLGDMLARWTNDRYRSTPHRVVGAPERDRYSIPFFVNPDPSVVVETIPTCVTLDRPARYQPVTAGDFLTSRIEGAREPYVDPDEGPVRTVVGR